MTQVPDSARKGPCGTSGPGPDAHGPAVSGLTMSGQTVSGLAEGVSGDPGPGVAGVPETGAAETGLAETGLAETGLAGRGPGVLVVGSLHHDIMVEAPGLPTWDETLAAIRWSPKFGGKGGNQALAVVRAGTGCRMLGAVGDDGFGVFMRGGLAAGAVDAAYVQTITGCGTGISVAIQNPEGAYAAVIVSGANLAIDAAPLEDAVFWHGMGALLLQNEVPEALNLAAALAARARKVPVILNAAPARDLAPGFAALVDVLVVNAVEADMMGAAPVTDLASAAVAAEHLASRFDAVVVTAGAAGLAAWSALDHAFTIPAEPVRVRSSHGAGDAFTGTLAAGLARGLPLEDACRAGSSAAARLVSEG